MVKSILSLLLLLISGLGAAGAWADSYRPLYRGTRAAAMGGAGVAVVEDEQSIFMNPAGLAGVKGFTFNYAAADVEISNDLLISGLSGAQAFSNLSVSTLNEFMGKNIYGHAQIAPSLVMKRFGIAFLSDHQAALREQNQANPEIGIGYQSTNGIQAAFGTSVLKSSDRHDLRVGLAGKILWRRGGYHLLGLLDVLNLSQSGMGALNEMNGVYGLGYGLDIGSQYLFKVNKKLVVSAGLAFTDIGDTTFASPQSSPQKNDLTVGLGASYVLTKAKLTFAWDLKRLTADVEFRERNRVGVEVALPFMSFYGGLYQMSLAYGFAFDVWVFRLTAASYSEDLGAFSNLNSERRYALRAALKIGF